MTLRELLITRARAKQADEDALFELESRMTYCDDCPVQNICDETNNGLSCFEEMLLHAHEEVDEKGLLIIK